METAGSVLLLLTGIALVMAAALVGKRKLSQKPRSQRRAELFSDYDRRMDRFRR